MPRLLTTPTKLCGLVAAAVLSAALMLALVGASSASASTKQISIFQDDSMLANPAAGLAEVRALGATTVRLTVQWYSLAPNPASAKAPKFDASNPNAYSAAKWAPYDAFVKTAQQMGITVLFQVGGGAPRWSEGKNVPSNYLKNHSFAWMPNATMYGQFVHALTERYSGTYKPSGTTTPLPAVHMWSFWNEPNFGQDLGPQAINGSTKPIAPMLYRALLNAGWKAIHQTQPHSKNTILIGEIAAKGYALHLPGHPGSLPGNTAQTQALVFVRALYCLGSNYRPLTGSLAALYSCPTTAAASRQFRAQNPGLFNATGFADHAYDSKEAPDANPATIPADDATFPVLKRVATALNKVTKAYGSSKQYPIYIDEFGVITNPPQTKGGYPSPAKAAVQLNQSEYLSYKNARVASYSQYLLDDPIPNPNPGFATGLFTSTGKPKATLNAYELPVWLPTPTVKAGSSTEVWGGARAAAFSQSATTKAAATVEIQMQKNGTGPWINIQAVNVSTTTGYFDVHPKLPYSGNLRLTYTYPKTESLLPTNVAGSTINGRTVKVTVSG